MDSRISIKLSVNSYGKMNQRTSTDLDLNQFQNKNNLNQVNRNN